MNKKLSRKTKKIILVYFAALIILFIIVQVLPRVTDIFETTQILEPGNLTLSHETTGYIIKDEQIGTAEKSGKIKYLVGDNVSVKKGQKIVSYDSDKVEENSKDKFSEYLDSLKGYDGVKATVNAPISGVFSKTIDGYEDYFTTDRMLSIKRNTVEGIHFDPVDLDRDYAVKGEPVFKISNDDRWYILCWVDSDTAEAYTEGRKVSIQLSDGTVDASVYKVKKDGDDYRVLFYSDMYYESFAGTRKDDIKIITSDNSGLLVKNKCIVQKNGQKGVYVRNKNGDDTFTRIQIIASDDKESVIEDATFIDEDGNQVYTVDVYDEVLKHPKGALEKDLKEESRQKDREKEN